MFEDLTQWGKVSTVFEQCFHSNGKATGRRTQTEAHSTAQNSAPDGLKKDLSTKPDTLNLLHI